MTPESLDQDLVRYSSFTSFYLPRSPSFATFFPIFKQTLVNKLDHLFEVTIILYEQKIWEFEFLNCVSFLEWGNNFCWNGDGETNGLVAKNGET